ncbi:hypothetical protein M514_23098 [Trichuris suis]|uniref:Uncharacterized protein n=1 Tax=Trichuris suis TaxID=68888 RepID=A0A085N5M9_9BILA|nr:hypothetical protein M514_23098 [Trichuris suis]
MYSITSVRSTNNLSRASSLKVGQNEPESYGTRRLLETQRTDNTNRSNRDPTSAQCVARLVGLHGYKPLHPTNFGRDLSCQLYLEPSSLDPTNAFYGINWFGKEEEFPPPRFSELSGLASTCRSTMDVSTEEPK